MDLAAVAVAASDHYVSRAAHKLVAALDTFGFEVSGRCALDLGASTGGFTQVLRERGAEPVIALDVGHGQLASAIAADPGVVVLARLPLGEIINTLKKKLTDGEPAGIKGEK